MKYPPTARTGRNAGRAQRVPQRKQAILERIRATYRIETTQTLEEAAAAMAGESSTGTFVPIPGETSELVKRFGAHVESLEPLEEAPAPGFEGSDGSRPIVGCNARGRVTLSWPAHNFGNSLPNVLAATCGNLTELREVSGLRLEDLDLPPSFLHRYRGPQFGVEGTRRLAGVEEARPLWGTIIKPSIGLDAGETAALVTDLLAAGLDFVKDDELTANPPHNPIAERVPRVMEAIECHASRAGRRPMYAFNVTGEIDEMLERLELVQRHGGSCAMVSLNHIGLPALAHLRRHSKVAIHGHRNGWGLLTRAAWLGVSFPAWQKLWRLAGADHLHVSGLRNKFWEPDASVVRSARACLAPLYPALGEAGSARAMPVVSSGQWAGQVPDTFAALGSPDFLFACGGGILAHPDGVAAGVRSLHEAWDAVRHGIPLIQHARTRTALARAIERFGPLNASPRSKETS
jgi:ribulose-bisphosphate carboxylase large chain